MSSICTKMYMPQRMTVYVNFDINDKLFCFEEQTWIRIDWVWLRNALNFLGKKELEAKRDFGLN